MEIDFKLIEKSNIEIILPLLQELDPAISEIDLKIRLLEMVEHGYECVGLYCANELIGICGIWILVKYYIGKHIEVDNVYIKPGYRNQGIGKKLDDWLNQFALSRHCVAIELNCYINNDKGKKFWVSNDYASIGIHYQKKLLQER